MKHSNRRFLLPDLLPAVARYRRGFALALCWALVSTGCVTSGTHEEVVAERDELLRKNEAVGQKAGHLEVSNASLEAERVRLYDDLEDLRVEKEALLAARSALEHDVMRLSESEGELSEQLEQTSQALSVASEESRKLKSTYQGLVADLENELQKGEIEIEQLRTGLRVGVSDEILFRPGSARLDASGREVLEKVAHNVAKLDYAVDVEGHTDDVPILGPLKKRYPSNWELAGARASSVVRLLQKTGIAGERLQAISRAEHAPVASNDDAEGRRMNRRIEIRLRPRETTEVDEPPPVADEGQTPAKESPAESAAVPDAS